MVSCQAVEDAEELEPAEDSLQQDSLDQDSSGADLLLLHPRRSYADNCDTVPFDPPAIMDTSEGVEDEVHQSGGDKELPEAPEASDEPVKGEGDSQRAGDNEVVASEEDRDARIQQLESLGCNQCLIHGGMQRLETKAAAGIPQAECHEDGFLSKSTFGPLFRPRLLQKRLWWWYLIPKKRPLVGMSQFLLPTR